MTFTTVSRGISKNLKINIKESLKGNFLTEWAESKFFTVMKKLLKRSNDFAKRFKTWETSLVTLHIQNRVSFSHFEICNLGGTHPKYINVFKSYYSDKFRRYEEMKATSTKGGDVNSSVLCIKMY